MNIKLLKELYKQAETECGWSEEKFAELIVKECARVYWNIDDGEIHGEYVKALKKHFGIKK